MRRNVSDEHADKIIKSLTERKFVDDRRFAVAYAKDKAQFSKWGKRKIRAMLQSKRISPEIIAEALQEIDESLADDNLLTLLKSKARQMDEISSYQAKAKLFRFAASRGYESDSIMRALSLLEKER